ncbi:hypothetical protein [Arcicella aurantiaca]|nr:hypothetical protein [Arcicella aurantiaca]
MKKKQSKDYNSESSTLITLGFFVLIMQKYSVIGYDVEIMR